MIKAVETKQLKQVIVCDSCGEESLQDDVLVEFDLPIIGKVDLHRMCMGRLIARLKGFIRNT